MTQNSKMRSSIMLGLTLLVVTPAVAQKTGTRIDRNAGAPGSISDRSVKSAIIIANGFGQCLARREGKSVQVVLDMPLMAPEQGKALGRSMEMYDGCLGDSSEFDELNASRLLVLGGAAEWFVGTSLKNADIDSINGMTDEALMQAEFRPRTELEDLGLCVIRRDVAKAKALLEAKPTSDSELAAIKAVTPELGPCVMEGTQLKLNVPNIRALIALAFYRAASKLGAVSA